MTSEPPLSLTQPRNIGSTFRIISRLSGFTLFEVALSLLLVSTGVVTLLILLPTGMRQINIQRYRTYASAVANQLIDVYAHADPSYACPPRRNASRCDLTIR